MNELDWAAGYFEGEGCITYSMRSKYKYPQITLGTTDKDTLLRFWKAVGHLGNIHPSSRASSLGSKPLHTWNLYGYPLCLLLLRRFWPGLGSRRKARAIEVMEATLPRAESRIWKEYCPDENKLRELLEQ